MLCIFVIFVTVTVQARVKDIDCTLMTSHLESTANHAAERKRQLKTAFDVMKKQDNTVIFGGDLNMRDKEVCCYYCC